MNRRIVSAAAATAALLLIALEATASAGATGAACPETNPPNELVLVGGSGQTAQLGKAFQGSLQVALANTNGCPVTGNLAGINIDFAAPGSGASGIFASSGTNHAAVGTNAQGVATAPPFTANNVSGSYSVHAESDFGTVKLYLTNTADGVPAAIAAAGGSGQQATVGSQYAQPLQARITDAAGRPVAGVTVNFSVVPGASGAGGSFVGGAGSVVTDSNGVATSPPLLANATPGRFTVVASTADLSAVASFTFDNHAASLKVSVVASDPSAVVGSRYATPLRARVTDASGQPLEGASVTFTISQSAHGAGASFVGGGSQAVVLADANGVAAAPALVANTTAGDFTVTASATGASGSASFTLLNRAAAPATATAGAASVESTDVGSRFRVPLVVTVADRYGNPVSGATVVFRAPARGASGRFLRGGRSSNAVSMKTDDKGIAVAPPFTANGKTGGYLVAANVAGTSVRAGFALVNQARG